jgi:hypothetical protein
MGKIININGNAFQYKKIKPAVKDGYLTYLQGDLNSYIFVSGWNGYRTTSGDVAGTIPANAPRIEVGLMGTPSMAGPVVILGMPDNSSGVTGFPVIYTMGNAYKIYTQGKGASDVNGVSIFDTSDNHLNVVVYGSYQSFIDGNMVVDNSNMANQYRLSAYPYDGTCIFAGKYGGSFRMSSPRIQYVKMYNGDTLVHDLRAYVKDGIPCMKDEVDGTYYYNQGTGTFLMGELLN